MFSKMQELVEAKADNEIKRQCTGMKPDTTKKQHSTSLSVKKSVVKESTENIPVAGSDDDDNVTMI